MGRLLRSLPPRRAPASLGGRVMAEIARRAALPWWRKSFAHWPAAVRALFVGAAVAAAALSVGGLFLLWQTPGGHQITNGVAGAYAWAITVGGYASSAASIARQVVAAVPPSLLYGGAGALAIIYTFAGALGAYAYRNLAFRRQET